jgi:hypothetical protein
MRRCDFSLAVGFSLVVWACSGAQALAEDRGAPPRAKKAQVAEPKPQPSKGKKKKPQKRGQKPPVNTQTQLAEKPKAAPPAAAAPALDDDVDVRTEGDKSVKAMEFSGLDIEGQLKTPQMLFFLNRLRAEFDRPRLPHRSFLPELARSRENKEL